MRPALPTLLLIAGCGGAPTAPVQVAVHTGSGLLVAVDPTGEGAWQRLATQADIPIEVGPRWIAASVCGYSSSMSVHVQAYGAEDGDEVTLPCRGSVVPPVPVPVTVVQQDLTDLVLGDAGYGHAENGVGTIYAPPGTWDLYASLWQTSRAVIQRDIVVDDSTSLTVDFDADGFDLENRDVVATNALSATAGYSMVWLSGGTFVALPWNLTDDTVVVIPEARTRAGDVQTAHLWTQDGAGNGQFAEVTFGDGPIAADLPGVVVDGAVHRDSPSLRASWRIDDADNASLSASSRLPTNAILRWTFVDRDAVAVGEIMFPDLTAIAGWDSAWNLPLDAELNAGIALMRQTDAGSVAASWTESFGATAPWSDARR